MKADSFGGFTAPVIVGELIVLGALLPQWKSHDS